MFNETKMSGVMGRCLFIRMGTVSLGRVWLPLMSPR